METAAVLVGKSAAIRALGEEAELAARTDVTVLIAGESGTRKEGLARLIHARSSRSRRPLTTVNCASAAAESRLTAALDASSGHDPTTPPGTVFLDEIGEMNARAQAALLKLLEGCHSGRAEGGEESPWNDVRIIAATRHHLMDRVLEQAFALDLYYRLNVVYLKIPPLRDRPDDIPPLMSHFFQLLSVAHLRAVPRLEAETVEALTAYAWPGNIRELRSIAEHLVLTTQTRIRPEDLPSHILHPYPPPIGPKYAPLPATII